MKLAGLATPLNLLKWLLAGTVIVFAFACAYVSVHTIYRQAVLHKISRYNVAWTVAQAVNEFMRLERQLAAFAVPGSTVAADEIQLRLDVMFSRLQTFEQTGPRPDLQRSIRRFFESDPANDATLVALRSALESIDPVVSRLRMTRNTAEVLGALEILRPLDAKLVALASAASTYAADQVEADRQELQNLTSLSSALAAVFIVCGFLLIILLVVHNGLLGRAQNKSRNLAEQLSAALTDLRLQNTRFDAALNNMPQALSMFDGKGMLAVFNEGFRQLTGLGRDLKVGIALSDLTARSSALFQSIFSLQKPSLEGGSTETMIYDNGDVSFSVRHSPLPDGGWLATYEDITEHRRAIDRIVHMAHHDGLTDLPNRLLFNAQLSSRLQQLQGRDLHLALFLLDLDNFKDVNDTLGHQVGDELLQVIAARLAGFVGDDTRISRISGDEFAVFSDPSPSLGSLRYADALIGHLSRPYHVDGNEIVVGVSIGVAECDGSDVPEPQELFRRADLALYRAKDSGRGRASLFDPSLDEQLQQRKRLELELAHALERREMVVHYQPIIDTRTQRPVGYEALLRWLHPELGLVPPAVFIPIAERTGAIFALGEWVLEQACAEAATWDEPLSIAVNLSPIQFRDGLLVDRVADVLRKTRLEPSLLELEITESVLLEASDHTLASLKRLKALGVQIAMDDFGTGYSSLSSLRSFAFDKIKIDRSFVKDLPASENARAVVELIIQLGRLLEMKVTAEGVENRAQLESLRDMSCAQVQGFLFDRARPMDELRPEHRPVRPAHRPIRQKRAG